jgi:hypothetical protein
MLNKALHGLTLRGFFFKGLSSLQEKISISLQKPISTEF